MKRSLCLGLLLVAASAVCSPELLEAQQDGGVQAESVEFRAVEGPQQEDVPGGVLLVGAYGVVLVLLVLYLVRLGAQQTRTARDLERVEKALAAKVGPSTGAGAEAGPAGEPSGGARKE